MIAREPVSAVNITAQYEGHQLLPADPQAVIPWEEARDRLAACESYWFATVGAGGRPHIRPVLGVWVDGLWCTTSNPDARKATNLARNPVCAVTAATDGIDVVVEGIASMLEDEATLRRVLDAYHAKYEFWRVSLRDGAFDAPDGAPTAGPPPYQPYAVTPTAIYGFGTDDRFASRCTRWRLAQS